MFDILETEQKPNRCQVVYSAVMTDSDLKKLLGEIGHKISDSVKQHSNPAPYTRQQQRNSLFKKDSPSR